MRTTPTILLAILTALLAVAIVRTPASTGPQAASGPAVELVGIQLQRSSAGLPVFEGNGSRSADDLRMALEVRLPRGRLLGLEPDRSGVELLQDGRGRSLMAEGHDPLDLATTLDPSGRFLRCFMTVPELPADATRVRAEGYLGLRVADRSRVHVGKQEQELCAGTRFQLGPYELELVEVETVEWNDRQSLTFTCDQPLDQIGAWRLMTGGGRRVDLEARSLYEVEGRWRQTLVGEEPLYSACLAIEVWEDVRPVEVPFRVQTELGL